jgi:hypothetical protein
MTRLVENAQVKHALFAAEQARDTAIRERDAIAAQTWKEAADMILNNREHGGVLYHVVEDMWRRAGLRPSQEPT